MEFCLTTIWLKAATIWLKAEQPRMSTPKDHNEAWWH